MPVYSCECSCLMPHARVHVGSSESSLQCQCSPSTMLETKSIVPCTVCSGQLHLDSIGPLGLQMSDITSIFKGILGTWTHSCMASALPLNHLISGTIMKLELDDCQWECRRVQFLPITNQPIKDIIPLWSHSSTHGYLYKITITTIGNSNRYLHADIHRSCIQSI